MKTFLKILAVSSLVCACNNEANTNNHSALRPNADSSVEATSGSARFLPLPPDPKTQLTATILSSKSEISELESEISDSLSRSGLSADRRSLFSRTIRQLEESSDVLNKQLEEIMVTDLRRSSERLSGIVIRMKSSEHELQAMIARLDRIATYLQTATNLLQALSPIKPALVKPAISQK